MPLAEAKKIDIGVNGTDIEIMTAEVELTTVLRNLVANAIHYTPENGMIDLQATQGSLGVTIAIEDSGPGVGPTERERVFEPFYRTLGTDVVGSGLGLSIVKTLVERLGGRIDLADATRFTSGLRVTITLL